MAEREREERERESETSKSAYIDLLYKGITIQCYNHFCCLYAYISKPQSVRKNTSGKDRCPYLCRIYLLTLLAYICKRCGARSDCSLRSSPTRTHNVRPKMARKTQQTQKADDLVVSDAPKVKSIGSLHFRFEIVAFILTFVGRYFSL